MVGKLLEKSEPNYGFDAATGKYTDMVTAGIIDPTKVVRLALQNAASVAGFLIMTEAMVADVPADPQAGPAMPPGGGMGGMGFKKSSGGVAGGTGPSLLPSFLPSFLPIKGTGEGPFADLPTSSLATSHQAARLDMPSKIVLPIQGPAMNWCL